MGLIAADGVGVAVTLGLIVAEVSIFTVEGVSLHPETRHVMK